MRPVSADTMGGGVSEDKGEAQRGDEEEEGSAAKRARDLAAPTTAEIAEHTVSHRPYRSWCSLASEAEAEARRHKAAKDSERTTPVLSADCCFVGAGYGGHQNNHVVRTQLQQERSRSRHVETLMEGSRRGGHGSDLENPVQAVKRRACLQLDSQHEVLKRPKVPFGSKRHGGTRELRMIVLTRVPKDTPEANVMQMIEPNTLIITFMVNHTATTINRFCVDQDGKTLMEKARETTANNEMVRKYCFSQ